MTDTDKLAFKQAVKLACLTALQQRMSNSAQAMNMAQDNANNQEKSSAGDKYETTRAMGQQDHAMNARQLQEAQREHTFLGNISTDTLHTAINIGSVVELNNKPFFIAIGLGTVSVEGGPVMVISHGSPLFTQLKHKKAGDTITINGKEQTVTSVF